jgi:hypothetical protein
MKAATFERVFDKGYLFFFTNKSKVGVVWCGTYYLIR